MAWEEETKAQRAVWAGYVRLMTVSTVVVIVVLGILAAALL